jgi:hypothetical protein
MVKEIAVEALGHLADLFGVWAVAVEQERLEIGLNLQQKVEMD